MVILQESIGDVYTSYLGIEAGVSKTEDSKKNIVSAIWRRKLYVHAVI